jgi:hypothetical protein
MTTILEGEVRESDSAGAGLESSEADAMVVPLVGTQPLALDQATPLLKGERPRQLELQDKTGARPITGVVNAKDSVHRHVDRQDRRQQIHPDQVIGSSHVRITRSQTRPA